MTTALERLEQQLDEKDDELSELQKKLETYEDVEQYRWMRHEEVGEDEEPKDLPVPRLEVRWTSNDDWKYSSTVVYALIYKHFLGHLVRVPLGVTKIRGGHGKPDLLTTTNSLPYRDGAHVKNEAKQLNLPAFVICEGKAVKLEALITPERL